MDNTSRFDGRGKNYDKFRTEYPDELFQVIAEQTKLNSSSVTVDLGLGTGKSARWFVERGHTVIGIEPNGEMIRKAAEMQMSYPNLTLYQNSAEDTKLAAGVADLIISGQSIQYFDIAAARVESRRILKKNGFICIFWYNEAPESDFENEYYRIVNRYRIPSSPHHDFRQIRDQNALALIAPNHYEKHILRHHQLLNDQGLKGRLLSSSHIPQVGSAEYDQMMRDLDQLIDELLPDLNSIQLNYETHLYIASIQCDQPGYFNAG